jgi:hypothetical protein
MKKLVQLFHTAGLRDDNAYHGDSVFHFRLLYSVFCFVSLIVV